MLRKIRGQIWVETVIYTLIALALIGMVLAFAIPAIQEKRDESLVESSIRVMDELSSIVDVVKFAGTSNRREFRFVMQKGVFTIDPTENKISLRIDDSAYAGSEVGKTIDISGTNLKMKTSESAKGYSVEIYRVLSDDIDLTYEDSNGLKEFSSASTPYNLMIENKGKVDGKWGIDIYIS